MSPSPSWLLRQRTVSSICFPVHKSDSVSNDVIKFVKVECVVGLIKSKSLSNRYTRIAWSFERALYVLEVGARRSTNLNSTDSLRHSLRTVVLDVRRCRNGFGKYWQADR